MFVSINNLKKAEIDSVGWWFAEIRHDSE